MDETDAAPQGRPDQGPAPANEEAQRAADGLKGQIAALREQVRKARAELLREAARRGEPGSLND